VNKFSKISLLSLLSLILSSVPLMKAQSAVVQEPLEAWLIGNNQGQTIDKERSYAAVVCDSTNTAYVTGHLHKTSQINQTLSIAVKKNGGTPIVSSYTFNTDGIGNGDFAITLPGFNPGKNDVVIEIQNNGFPGVNLYFNQSANNYAAAYGIPFNCP
jgi:hypothetical protein